MKKAVTILAISTAVMVVLAILGISGMVGLFNSSLDRMEAALKVRNKEIERIRQLPELKAIVTSSGHVSAPFSRKEVACYGLAQGLRLYPSGRHSGHSGGPSFLFEDDVVLVGGPGLVVSINGQEHHALPDSAILYWRSDGSPNSSWTERIKGRKFVSNKWGASYNPEYDEYNSAVMTMKGRSGLLDRYINKPSAFHEPDVYVEELLFEVGDTMIFKGRLEDGRIVPLF